MNNLDGILFCFGKVDEKQCKFKKNKPHFNLTTLDHAGRLNTNTQPYVYVQ